MSTTVVLIKAATIPEAMMAIDANHAIDQNIEQRLTAKAIRRLVSKLDRRLIPFLVILEMSSYINRNSIGHAKLMGIEKDLQMSRSESDWAIAIFFLAYLIFGIPSNLLLRFLGPTRYLSLSTIAWGSITIGTAFVRNTRELIIVRFLLGMGEAGFFPSMVIYFSLWYCKREQTMRIAILYGAAIMASAVGGILAYGIAKMENIGGLKGWQWTFLLEGLPNIPLGIITYLFLRNIPDTVQWLNNCEKQLLTNVLREDAGAASSESISCTRLSWRQVGYAFVDWRIYLYAVIGICDFGVIKFLTTYLPSLVRDIGHTTESAHFMTVPLYVVACAFCLLGGYSSSRQKEHSFHLAFCLSVALLGFILILALFDQGKTALFVSTCLACCGTFAACPLIMSWLTNNVGGHTKRATAVGFVVCIGQIGGIIAPQVYRDVDKPIYRRGHLICSGLLVVSLIVTFVLRFSLKAENRRRDHLSIDQHGREAAIKEPCDRHPDIRYIL